MSAFGKGKRRTVVHLDTHMHAAVSSAHGGDGKKEGAVKIV